MDGSGDLCGLAFSLAIGGNCACASCRTASVSPGSSLSWWETPLFGGPLDLTGISVPGCEEYPE